MLRLIDSHQSGDLLEEEGGLLSYIEMHLPQEQIEEVQQKLKEVLDLLQGFEDKGTESDEEGIRKFRLTIAHYPLDRFA
jgi:hypothetical protein